MTESDKKRIISALFARNL